MKYDIFDIVHDMYSDMMISDYIWQRYALYTYIYTCLHIHDPSLSLYMFMSDIYLWIPELTGHVHDSYLSQAWATVHGGYDETSSAVCLEWRF